MGRKTDKKIKINVNNWGKHGIWAKFYDKQL